MSNCVIVSNFVMFCRFFCNGLGDKFIYNKYSVRKGCLLVARWLPLYRVKWGNLSKKNCFRVVYHLKNEFLSFNQFTKLSPHHIFWRRCTSLLSYEETRRYSQLWPATLWGLSCLVAPSDFPPQAHITLNEILIYYEA